MFLLKLKIDSKKTAVEDENWKCFSSVKSATNRHIIKFATSKAFCFINHSNDTVFHSDLQKIHFNLLSKFNLKSWKKRKGLTKKCEDFRGTGREYPNEAM